MVETYHGACGMKRAQIVQKYQGLVLAIASDNKHRWQCEREGVKHADLVQAGNVGLLRAIDTWDESRGPFLPHAARTIRDHVHAAYGRTWAGKRYRPRFASLEAWSESIGGEDPTCLVGGDPGDPDSPDFDFDTIADFGRPAHERTSVASARRKLEALISSPVLSEREREILAARMDGKTQAETADEVGINRPNVARGEARAVEKLRAGVLRRSSHTPPATNPRTKGPRT